MNSKTTSLPCGTNTKSIFQSVAEIQANQAVKFSGFGQHLLVDFDNCQSMVDTSDQLEQIMLKTARKINATIVTSSFHEFNPQGLSGVVVIAESHLAIHTWPEHNAACVDLFTCSAEMDSMAGIAFLFESFSAQSVSIETISRGCSSRGCSIKQGPFEAGEK